RCPSADTARASITPSGLALALKAAPGTGAPVATSSTARKGVAGAAGRALESTRLVKDPATNRRLPASATAVTSWAYLTALWFGSVRVVSAGVPQVTSATEENVCGAADGAAAGA